MDTHVTFPQYNDDVMYVYAWVLPADSCIRRRPTAAYYRYRAYGDPNLFSHAIETWEHVSN